MNGKMNRVGSLAVAVLILCFGLGLANAIFTATRQVPGQGKVIVFNIEAYSDSACTVPLTSVSWGELVPGQVTTYTLYIKNTGNKDAILGMTNNSWTPTNAGQYISITWNREGTTIAKGVVTSAVLTLTISSTITGIDAFSHVVSISAHS